MQRWASMIANDILETEYEETIIIEVKYTETKLIAGKRPKNLRWGKEGAKQLRRRRTN